MAISIKKITKINDKVNYFNLKEQNIRADSIDEDIVSECMRNFLNLKYEHVGYFHEGLAWFKSNGKYGLINKEGKEITDICFNNITISDDVIIFNDEYIVPIKDLSFAYCCKLNINGKEKNIQFNSMEKRDEFCNLTNKKIKDMQTKLDDLRNKMEEELLNKENKLYKDFDLEVQNEYTKIKKMD